SSRRRPDVAVPAIGHLVSDEAGLIRQADPAAALLLGVAARFVCGKPLAVFVTPATRRRFRRELLAAVRDGSTHAFVVGLAPRDAPTRDVELIASPAPSGEAGGPWTPRTPPRGPRREGGALLRGGPGGAPLPPPPPP